MEFAIKDLLATEEKTLWVRYTDEFEINIRYLPRRELARISESSQEVTWDKKTHTRIDRVDTEKFYSKFVEKAILGWRGLTLKTLAKIVPIKLGDSDPTNEVVFTKENAIELLRSAYDLDSFLQDAILDVQRFDSEQIDAQKKTS